MVRRAISINIGKFSDVIESPSDELIQGFRSLLRDGQDAVRTHALNNSLSLIKLLSEQKPQELKDSIIPAIKSCAEDKSSWRVRFSVCEISGKLAAAVGHDIADEHIVPIMEKLLKDSEAEVRSQAVERISELAQHVSVEVVCDKLLGIVSSNMCSDSSQHVRGALACAIPKIAVSIGKDHTLLHLVLTIVNLLKDTATEVRISLLDNLGDIAQVLGKDDTDVHLIPSLIELAKDNQWRVRLATMRYFPKLARLLDQDLFKERLEEVLINWLGDKVFQIREKAIDNMIELKEVFGYEWFENIMIKRIKDLIKHLSFQKRLNAVIILKKLMHEVKKEVINGEVIELFLELKDDKVPNIRFNFAKTLAELSPLLDEKYIEQGKLALDQLENTDLDEDVRYYAKQALKSELLKA